jgi:hypothetical protein
VDRLEVDAESGKQLGVAGLGPGEHAPGDQPVDLDPGGLQVEAVGGQDSGGRVVVLEEQPEEQVLGAEVLVPEPPGFHPGQAGGGGGRPGDVH